MSKSTQPKPTNNRNADYWLSDDGDWQETSQRLISMKYNPRIAVRIEGEVIHKEMPGLAQGGDGTIPVVAVTDLTTGEVATLIVPTLLESYLAMHNGCIGKKLAIRRGERVANKRYFAVQVKELSE